MLQHSTIIDFPFHDLDDLSTLFDPSGWVSGVYNGVLGSNRRARDPMCKHLPFYDLKDLSSVLRPAGHAAVYYDDDDPVLSRPGFEVFQEHRRKHSRWGKHVEDLSRLLYEPREVLYEVLGHLHPIDLCHLARTNKWFRAILMSQTSAWLWDLAFQRHPEIPYTPRNTAHCKWTDMVFGRIDCTECNYTGEWGCTVWRRKYCQDCWHSVIEPKVISELDFLDSSEPPVEPGDFPEFQFYADTRLDLQHVADRVITYQNLIFWDSYATPAEKCLSYFKSHPPTKDFVEIVLEQHKLLEDWTEDHTTRMHQEGYKRRQYFFSLHERVLAELMRRLKPFGHAECDIRELFERPEGSCYFTPTKAALSKCLAPRRKTLKKPLAYIRNNWPSVKATLEPMILVIATPRLAKERENLINYRQETILRVLEDHKTLIANADLWDNLPSLHDLLSYEPFVSLIHLPSDVPLGPELYINEITSFIERWPPRTMEELAAICPSNFQIPVCHLTHRGTYNLEAASSVFSCIACATIGPDSAGSCLIGWNALVTHRTCRRRRLYNPFQVRETGCAAVMALLDVVGFDASTTLPNQLDEHGGKFVCLSCSKADGAHSGLTWRQCVSHFIEMHRIGMHASPSWKMMSHEKALINDILEPDEGDLGGNLSAESFRLHV